jgi:type I restriction enzyme R subunit
MFVSSSRQIAYDLYKEIIKLRPQWAEVRECDEGVTLSEKDRPLCLNSCRQTTVITVNKQQTLQAEDSASVAWFITFF